MGTKNTFLTESDIVGSTMRELERYRGQFPAVAYKAKVSYSWLVKFAGGTFDHPRMTEMQKLITTLGRLRRGQIKLDS